jgi:hypothetical protein
LIHNSQILNAKFEILKCSKYVNNKEKLSRRWHRRTTSVPYNKSFLKEIAKMLIIKETWYTWLY